MDKLLKVGQAARYLGVTAGTIRRWEKIGRLPCQRVGDRADRRFWRNDLEAMRKPGVRSAAPAETAAPREALYVRVSGRGDQISSLRNQETELRASARGPVIAVYRDVASGLSEGRRGLERALRAAQEGKYDVLRVTHRDRLARFGTKWIESTLDSAQVRLEVLHPEDPEADLMSDFMSLIASFAGRLYGQRSVQARQRLLSQAQEQL